METHHATSGPVSVGTAEPQILMDRCITSLRQLNEAAKQSDDDDADPVRWVGIDMLLTEIEERRIGEEYYLSDQCREDLSLLFEALSEFAPAGHHFGPAASDTTNYGFWPN